MPGDTTKRDSHRRSFLKRSAALGGAAAGAWVAPTLLTVPVAAAVSGPCPTGVNLVTNGDASSGLTGWTPGPNGGLILGGSLPDQYFEAPASNASYQSSQTVDLTGLCDGDTVTLSADLRASHNTDTSVTVTWYAGLGGTGANLGTLSVTRAATSFGVETNNGTVPAGAQSFVVLMVAQGHPAQTVGGVDDVSVILS